MKKILSVVLALAVVFGCCTAVYAASSTSDSKISTELQNQIDKIGDNDKLTVQIWVNCVIDEAEIDCEVRKQIGAHNIFSDGELTNQYIILYQKMLSEKEKEARNTVIEKIGIAPEDIYYSADIMILANLTKEQVIQAAACAEVNEMYYKTVEDELKTDPTEPQTETPAQEYKPIQGQVEPGYYLCSAKTDWLMLPENQFVRTDDPDHEEYVLRDCKLYVSQPDVSQPFEIVYTDDGMKNKKFYYPTMDINYLEGYIRADGVYDVYFRPNHDGDAYTDNTGWVYRCIRVEYNGAESVQKHYLYQDSFNRYMKEYLEEGYDDGYQYANYNELYYHKDENGETDWALIKAEIGYVGGWIGNRFVSNRVVTTRMFREPFFGTMGVYDVKNDQFYDVCYMDGAHLDDFDEIYDKIGYGRLMGDLDLDDEITVIDVTILQRCHANITPFPREDSIDIIWTYIEPYYGTEIHYYSDFDRNGERDITDATMIQRYLANIG